MLASILDYGDPFSRMELEGLLKSDYCDYFKFGSSEIPIVFNQLDSNLNVGLSSSTGRFLDAISVALGICGSRNYEGEAAMKLESVAYYSKEEIDIPFSFVKYDGRTVLDTSSILSEIVRLKNSGVRVSDIAAAGQKCVSEGLSELAVRAANSKNVDYIGGTGGTFYNEAISLHVKNYVENSGLNFIQHKNSCAGDGSVSLGQAIIAGRQRL